jgi:hypothetical protein
MAMMGDAPTLRTLAFRVLAKTGTPRGTNAGHERNNLSQRPVWPGTGKTMLPQRDNCVVPLSHALGLGHWDTTATSGTALGTDVGQAAEAQRIPDPYARAFTALRARCPDHVEEERWRQCVADAERFLGRWGEQAEALGWTAKDLFGLHKPPEKPHPSYSRLSRYDETGLIWLLEGRRVVALTEGTAAIQNSASGSITMYRRHNKPALGPFGDSLDDLAGGHL